MPDSHGAWLETRLVLVRHGQSRATVERIAGGLRSCRGLTELGIRQAEALRDRVAATGELAGATALVASTLPRAVETAEVLAPALGELEVEHDPELCEMHPGEADGLTWEDFEARYGAFDLEMEPYRRLSPGGESWAEFELRVGRAISGLVDRYAGGEVVVVCHGGVIGASLATLLGLAGKGPRAVVAEVRNTSLTEWRCTSFADRPPLWKLVRFNDATHLGVGDEPYPVAWAAAAGTGSGGAGPAAGDTAEPVSALQPPA